MQLLKKCAFFFQCRLAAVSRLGRLGVINSLLSLCDKCELFSIVEPKAIEELLVPDLEQHQV